MHYEVRFTVRLPEGVCATQREVEDWLRFNLRDTGSLDNKMPCERDCVPKAL